MELGNLSTASSFLNYDVARLDSAKQLSESVNQNSSNYSDDKLLEVAEDFTSIFMNLVFKQMRSTLNTKDSLLYGGMQEEVFSDMLYEEYSKISSKKGNVGYELTKSIYDFMKSNMSGSNNMNIVDKVV